MNYNAQRWMTLAACMLAALCAGFGYAWSVLMKPLSVLHNWSSSDVSLSFTLVMAMACVAAIIVGKLLEYVQPRTIILAGGLMFGAGLIGTSFSNSLGQFYIYVIIAGLGMGCVYPGGSMSNTVKFFPDKKGLVSGLLSAGYGLGSVIWAPFAAYIILSFGVLAALKVLGILFLALIVIFSRFVATTPEGFIPDNWKAAQSTLSDSPSEKTWRQMMSDGLFYLIAIVFTFGEITGMMAIGHASPMAQDMLGLTPAAAAGVVSILSIANTLGKLFWGWISDRIGRYPVLALLLILGSIAMFMMTRVSSYYSFTVFIAVIGLCYGGYLSVMAPLTADLFGNKNLGINYGIMFFTVAIASFIGPQLASIVNQTYNGYSMAFYYALIFNIIGIIVFALFIFLRNKRVKQSNA